MKSKPTKKKRASTKRGFWATAHAAALAPRLFFSEPVGARGRWTPLKFAIGVSAIALPLGTAGDLLVAGENLGSAIGVGVGMLVISPLLAVVSVYFTSALTHFWLLVVRGKQGTFSDTLSCVGYSAAPTLLGVIPMVGGAVGGIWQFVVLALGLKGRHRTTSARAAFAVLAGPVSMVLLALSFRFLVAEAFKIPSGAMLPTLQIDDHLFVSKLAYGPALPLTGTRLYSRLPPQYGDVMVFEFPDPNPSNPRQDFTNRVIALPGDELVVEDGHPIINGWRVPSCHVGAYEFTVVGDARPTRGELIIEFLGASTHLVFLEAERFDGRQGPYSVGANEVWVLGDNRNNSSDSRSWFDGKGGGVPFENIKGRASLVWMAFAEDGAVDFDRLLHPVMGTPVLPKGAPAELTDGIDKCLASRPPLAQTTPPKAQGL
ncbi:MAG TPA: signal peptidase I [Polyangiaceae bacterium]|nr:signal peptidase I [Polyangiaceae bacterium]